MGRGARTFNRVLLWVLISVVVAVVILVGSVLYRVVVNESVSFKRGSLEYQLLMESSFIEGIDTGECEASYYFMLMEEGESDVYGVELTHSEFPVEAMNAFRKHLRGLGACTGFPESDEEIRMEGEIAGYFYDCTGGLGTIGVWVMRIGGVWRLNVSHAP